MDKKNPIDLIALILVVVGAINWGLTAFGYNLVDMIFVDALGFGIIATIVYVLVALSGLYMLYAEFMKK